MPRDFAIQKLKFPSKNKNSDISLRKSLTKEKLTFHKKCSKLKQRNYFVPEKVNILRGLLLVMKSQKCEG